MLLREAALRVAVAQLGVVERGGNNRGPDVRKYLAETGLGEGFPWCAAFVSWCFRQAAGKKLAWESAGVLKIATYAHDHGWLVSRPLRGDLVCFEFGANSLHDDHIGFVERVLRLGPMLTLTTIEGNTSSGAAGSQSDGGGVYRRTRIVRASSVVFVRVPGNAPAAVTVTGPVVAGGTGTATSSSGTHVVYVPAKPAKLDLSKVSDADLLAELGKRLAA